MMDPSPIVEVVAGILRREGNILACQRRIGSPFGGQWELPGGKIRAGEGPREALVRELQEELGVTAQPGAQVERIRHHYPDHATVELRFYEIDSFQGEPENLCFEEIRWVPAPELPDLPWLEADWPLVRQLARGSRP